MTERSGGVAGREPWFAVNLSLVLPGLGQFHSGTPVRGAGFLAAFLGLHGGFGYFLLSPDGNPLAAAACLGGIPLVILLALVDAHRTVRRANDPAFEKTRKASPDPWLAAFLTVILPGLGHAYARRRVWAVAVFLGWGAVLILHDVHTVFIPLTILYTGSMALHAYASAPVRREASLTRAVTVAVLITLAGAVINLGPRLFRMHIADVFSMPTPSMAPVLMPGDKILAMKQLPGTFTRGDLLLFRAPENPAKIFIKRLVAVESDVVEIRRNGLYVNKARVTEAPMANIHYTSEGRYAGEGQPLTVPPGHLFLLGDNTVQSRDCRFLGPIPKENVIALAYRIFWPPDRAGPIE